VSDADVYRFQPGRPAQPVVSSTFSDTESRFSPDGRRLAFGSMRSGDKNEVWVAEADGSRAQQLTHGPGYGQGSPSWSPDGRRIVFDSFGGDWHSHLWIVDADGGTPHQLTTAAGGQYVPSWSRDGRWIYFSTGVQSSVRQGNRFDIWRVAATGGPPQRVTRDGSGRFACESADGKSLLYQPKDSNSPLLMLPLAGGPARQLVACVRATAFGIGPQGVYYVACDPGPDPPVHVVDPLTGRDRVLGTLQNYEDSTNFLPLGLAVAADGSVLYLRHMSDSADLMLIENFR
jgi:Tol biopolymer transport system component